MNCPRALLPIIRSELTLKSLCPLLFIMPLLFTACSKRPSKPAPKTEKHVIVPDRQLSHRLDSVLHRIEWGNHVAVYIYDITADAPLFAFRADSLMPPASCLKLLTGIAMLKRMGPEYSYATGLYTRGKIKGDTLQGDLIFRGSMDPVFKPEELHLIFRPMQKRGIRHLTGHLVINLAHDEFPTPEPHWYPGDLAMYQYGLYYQHRDKIRRLVKAAARSYGLTVRDSAVVFGPLPRDNHKLYVFKRQMTFSLRRAWKNSSNTVSNGLLYTLGTTQYDGKSYRQSGVRVLRQFVKEELGDTTSRYVSHDGCGLCSQDRVTPVFLVNLLRYAQRDKKLYAYMLHYLPISGVDGTLRRQMPAPATRGKVIAKTGTLSHPYGISTLAGYVTGANGHLLAFAIMNADMSVLDARPLQNKLCAEMVK